MFCFFRAERKVGINNGSIGSSSSGLGSSGGLLSGGDSEINGSESVKVKRENILSELQLTESRYTDDLEQVLRNYRYVNLFNTKYELFNHCLPGQNGIWIQKLYWLPKYL